MSNVAIFGYPSWILSPSEGFPWDDLRKILHGGQWKARLQNGIRSTGWVGCTNECYRLQRDRRVDDRQTTDRINQSINLRLLAACQNAGQQCTISKTHMIVQNFKSYVPNICLCTAFVWWKLESDKRVVCDGSCSEVCDIWGCISAMQRIEEVLVCGGRQVWWAVPVAPREIQHRVDALAVWHFGETTSRPGGVHQTSNDGGTVDVMQSVDRRPARKLRSTGNA